jgi:TRAP-type C4-dicarboxylate transport system substrate-binding protein
MKKMFVFITVLMMSIFIISVVGSGTSMAQKKPIVLRLVVPSPAGDWPLTFMNTELARRFNERAKGEYVIEAHPDPGGALAKIPEYFDAVRIGSVEIACGPWGMFSFLDPRLGVIETPFLFNSSPAASASCKPILPLYDQILQEKFNAKGLGLYNSGGVNLFSSKPVKTLADWKGLLVGCLSPSASALAKELGASSVTVMWVDMYESLQKRVIEAVIQGTHGGVVTNIPEVCKNVIFFYGLSGWNGFSINLDIWKKMPPHIQKILSEEAIASSEWMNKTVDGELGEKDMKYFKDKGTSVYFVPKAERDRWEKVLAPYKEKQIAALGEFGQKVKKIADDLNKKFPYTQRGLY